MKSQLIWLCSIVACNLFGQVSEIKTSFGVLFSDVRSATADGYYNYGNTWKKCFWGTVGAEYKLSKLISFEGGVTYQERKALEVFVFPTGDSMKQTSGLHASEWVFAKFPTSHQSKGFDIPNSGYLNFPNFKYLNFEIIPVIKVGNKMQFSAGVGIFGGILLNRRKTTVSKEDLPTVEAFFHAPFNVFGEVLYHRYDFGLLPKVSCIYPVSDRLGIGVEFKSYQSLLRLNDTFVWPADWSKNNVHWKVFYAGVDFNFKIHKAKRRKSQTLKKLGSSKMSQKRFQ